MAMPHANTPTPQQVASNTPRNALGEPVRAPLTAPTVALSTLADYAQAAAHHVEATAWHHIEAGADQGLSLNASRAALDAWRLIPEPLADLHHAHTRCELLGQSTVSPLWLAPVAYQRLAHPEGELATVRAAMAARVGMVVSTLASCTLEAIAQAAQAATAELGHGAPLWFQLYSQPRQADTLSLVRRAEDAGYQALVWTVDAAIKPTRFALPDGVSAVNLAGMTTWHHESQLGADCVLLDSPLVRGAPSWDELAWLRSQTQLPLLVKGVLSPRGAAHAVAAGADALIVSNHGGRVLDGSITPLDALPAIRQALPAATPVMLDGGIRWGTDVVKALALGANAVAIGRPQLHALAVAGMLGVAHMLHLLRAELELALAQLGCPTLAALGPDRLWRP